MKDALNEEMCKDEKKKSFRCKSPNSQDLNVLNLEYFHSVWLHQDKKVAKNIDDLAVAVKESFTS